MKFPPSPPWESTTNLLFFGKERSRIYCSPQKMETIMEAKKTEKPDIYTLLNELFAVQMSESQLFEEALETLEETRREIVKQLMGDFREKQARLEQEFASLGALNGQKLAEAYFDAFLTAFNGTVQRGCDAVMSNRLEKS